MPFGFNTGGGGLASTAVGRAILNAANKAAQQLLLDIFPYPDRVVNLYYPLDELAGTSTGGNIGTAIIRAWPIKVNRRITIDRLAARISTAGAAGNCKLAIYAHDAAARKPGALLAQTADISTNATGMVESALTGGGSLTLEPGLYWGALKVDNSSVIFLGYATAFAAGMLFGSGDLAGLFPSNTTQYQCTYSGVTYSDAFPSTLVGVTATTGGSNNNVFLGGRCSAL